MNVGALRVRNDFFSKKEIENILISIKSKSWKPVWEDDSYGDDNWREIKLISSYTDEASYNSFPELEKVKKFFETDIISMMFYSMAPGSKIHPHRDMIGNVGWGGLRFHIPIQTNPNLIFMVSNERVVMSAGELWALDTSFLHSVENMGDAERIHLVFDVKVNGWVKKNLLPPLDARYVIHQIFLIFLYFRKFASVLLNPLELKRNGREMLRTLRNLHNRK